MKERRTPIRHQPGITDEYGNPYGEHEVGPINGGTTSSSGFTLLFFIGFLAAIIAAVSGEEAMANCVGAFVVVSCFFGIIFVLGFGLTEAKN